MDSIAVLILAAGKGTRMKSDMAKAMHEVSGKSIIQRLLRSVGKLDPKRMVIVTGHQKEDVEANILAGAESGHYPKEAISFALQDEQLGTGHAAQCAVPALEDFSGPVIILPGDTPLLTTATLKNLIKLHSEKSATASLISFSAPVESSYGRIIRDSSDEFVVKIVEAKDCTPEELQVTEVNSAMYIVESAFLKPALESLKSENTQNEYYLTDIFEKAHEEGQTIAALKLDNADELIGINTRIQLAEAEGILRQQKVNELIEAGVYFSDPDTVYIDDAVEIGSETKIGPNVILKGNTKIGSQVVIDGSVFLEDTEVGDSSHIKFCVRTEKAVIGKAASIGPFANLRPNTKTGEGVRIGNFVETKKTTLRDGSKAPHLSYVGDADIGENSNIGAGTITCNYDGANKHQTVLGKNVFIGSNSSLVAPVNIADGATVGAGSTITKDVPADSLAVTRAPMKVKNGWERPKKDS